MRQVMPHRNNIAVQRTKRKMFFADGRPRRAKLGEIEAKITLISSDWIQKSSRYSHTKQWFIRTIQAGPLRRSHRNRYGTYADTA